MNRQCKLKFKARSYPGFARTTKKTQPDARETKLEPNESVSLKQMLCWTDGDCTYHKAEHRSFD
jgi:hypothetical protein